MAKNWSLNSKDYQKIFDCQRFEHFYLLIIAIDKMQLETNNIPCSFSSKIYQLTSK